jgi:hypothetical protein
VNGHFPGYDVLDRAHLWDPVTTGVVLRRMGPPPPLRYFTPEEEAVARPLLDRLLALDRDEREVPVFELIDGRLAEGEIDGWRYDDMPEDGAAWRRSLRHLREDGFLDLDRQGRVDLLQRIHDADDWHGLPAGRVWSLWMRYACAVFYSHPWAWNEMGFGGPAYPVGYKNLGVDGREDWEVREHDARDPEPWAHRVERARRRHAGEG